MFAVGIDVSNGRSTVAALRTKTDIVMKPFNITHNLDGLSNLVKQL